LRPLPHFPSGIKNMTKDNEAGKLTDIANVIFLSVCVLNTGLDLACLK
jgi:hypothetical protein